MELSQKFFNAILDKEEYMLKNKSAKFKIENIYLKKIKIITMIIIDLKIVNESDYDLISGYLKGNKLYDEIIIS